MLVQVWTDGKGFFSAKEELGAALVSVGYSQ